ncbi:MAG: S8 family peptidase [bacterium]
MKTIFLTLITAVLLLTLFSCSQENNPVDDSKILQDNGKSTGEITSGNVVRKIVVLKRGASQASVVNMVGKRGGHVNQQYSLINAISVFLPENASEKAIEALTKHADVERIDDDIIISAKPPKDPPTPPPPPTETLPWGVDRIDAEQVSGGGGTGTVIIKVGIVDTGIDRNHPDLAANLVGGINIISPTKTYEDDNGHGTHVAGTVAAVDNEIGVIGVAPHVAIYAVKVLDRRGNGYLSDIISGLQWCVNNGIQVINMSLSATVDVQSFHDAVTATYNAGIVMVCAAGNSGSVVEYPAKYSETIAVSATDINDAFAYFSNYGPEIAVAAPGVNVYSTYKGDTYKYLNGTSMASPHVAGVAALVLARYNSLTPAQVKAHIQATAENIGLSTNQQGAGLVDALNAWNTTPQ